MLPVASVTKIETGTVINKHILLTVQAKRVEVPDPAQLVHLQFRRFAGCPLCSLHLHSFIARRDEITAAGIQTVAVFYSSSVALTPYFEDAPLAVVADPDKTLYREFGVETGWQAILNPRVILPALRGIFAKGLRLPRFWAEETPFGLPADFLIARDGRVLAFQYGAHAYEQWSVDTLLALARTASMQ